MVYLTLFLRGMKNANAINAAQTITVTKTPIKMREPIAGVPSDLVEML